MTTTRTCLGQPDFTADTTTTRALRALRRALTAFGTWSEHRRAIAQLQTLSDLQLKDLGISRSQIEPNVRGSAWRDVA